MNNYNYLLIFATVGMLLTACVMEKHFADQDLEFQEFYSVGVRGAE